MSRWRIRTVLVYLVVFSVPAYALFWDRISATWRLGLPCLLAAVLLVFGWYDLRKDLDENDPLKKEIEKERRETNRGGEE